MEDFTLDIIIGEGPSARTVKLELPRFTLVGATTRTGLLSPLRDRFGIQCRLQYYSAEELQIIILRSAAKLEIEIVEEAALEMARQQEGPPESPIVFLNAAEILQIYKLLALLDWLCSGKS